MIKQSSGFSLVEVMAAIVILTLAFFPILAYFTNSIGIVSQREILSQANNLAVDTMEFLVSEADLNSSNLLTTAADFDISDLDGYDLFVDFEILVDVDHFDTSLNIYDNASEIITAGEEELETLKKISVNISWENGQKSYQLDSLVKVW